MTAVSAQFSGDWLRRQPRALIAWTLLAVLMTIGISMSATFRSEPVLVETPAESRLNHVSIVNVAAFRPGAAPKVTYAFVPPS